VLSLRGMGAVDFARAASNRGSVEANSNRQERQEMSISPLNPEFNDFLFASIGEEKNGMLLSVLSALARLDIDPWQEAVRLARLPKDLARQSLASLIAGLPSGRWAPSDSTVIAARLAQLLPSRNSSKASSVVANRSVLEMTRHLAMMWLIYAAICGALFIVEGKREQPSSMNHTDAPLTNAVSPPQVRLLDSD
jgi:hypothetical protein